MPSVACGLWLKLSVPQRLPNSRLLSLFEVHEIEFAQSHGFLNLLGISGVVGGVCCIRVCAIDEIDCG